MPSPSNPRQRPFLVAAMVAVGLLALTAPATAERTQSDLVLIREDDVVAEDLYAAGNRIEVQGRIEGDLVAVAFEEILITGEVTGDVLAVASRVGVTGFVGGSLRAAAPTMTIEGEITDDVLAAGWSMTQASPSRIGRDLIVWGRRLEQAGEINRNLEGGPANLILSGRVGGNVEVSVSQLTVTSSADIGGDLAYRSERSAVIAEGATITGSAIQRHPQPPNVRLRALKLLTGVVVVVALTAVGLAVIWAWPGQALASARAVRAGLARCLASGLALAAAPLVVAMTAVVLLGLAPASAGLPLLAVLAPLAVAASGVAATGAIVASVPVAIAIGWRLLPGKSSFTRYLTGMGVLVVVSLIPWAGGPLILLAAMLGLGGWLRGGVLSLQPQP